MNEWYDDEFSPTEACQSSRTAKDVVRRKIQCRKCPVRRPKLLIEFFGREEILEPPSPKNAGTAGPSKVRSEWLRPEVKQPAVPNRAAESREGSLLSTLRPAYGGGPQTPSTPGSTRIREEDFPLDIQFY